MEEFELFLKDWLISLKRSSVEVYFPVDLALLSKSVLDFDLEYGSIDGGSKDFVDKGCWK